jgi:Secretion system C-terminal sorting domain
MNKTLQLLTAIIIMQFIGLQTSFSTPDSVKTPMAYLGDKIENLDHYIEYHDMLTWKPYNITTYMKNGKISKIVRKDMHVMEVKKDYQELFEYNTNDNSLTRIWQRIRDGIATNEKKYYTKLDNYDRELINNEYEWFDNSWIPKLFYKYEYDGEKLLLDEYEYYSDVVLSGGKRLTYEYDESGNQTSILEEAYNGTTWVKKFLNIYEYDVSNNLIKSEEYRSGGISVGKPTIGNYRKYDSKDRLVEWQFFSKNGGTTYSQERLATWTYDSYDHFITEKWYNTYQGISTISILDSVSYDEYGNEIYSIRIKYFEGTLDKKFISNDVYDDGKYQISGEYLEYDSNELVSGGRTNYHYNNDNLLDTVIKSGYYDKQWSYTKLETSEYDAIGRCNFMDQYNFRGGRFILTRVESLTFDEKDRVIYQSILDSNSRNYNEIERTFDSNDYLSKTITYSKKILNTSGSRDTLSIAHSFNNYLLVQSDFLYTATKYPNALITQKKDEYKYDSQSRLSLYECKSSQYDNFSNLIDKNTDKFFTEETNSNDTLFFENISKIEFFWRDTTTSVENNYTENKSQAHPNPFAETTTIDYELNASDNINFELVDVSGNTVVTKNEGRKNEGSHSLKINGQGLPSGSYYYSITGDKHRLSGQIILKK